MGSRVVLAVVLLSVALPVTGAVDSGGSISGVVRDADGDEPIVGVQVVLSPGGREAVTDELGRFVFTGLVPGPYRVELRNVGYRITDAGPFDLAAGEPLLLDLPLEKHTLQESVTVRPTAAAEVTGRFPTEMSREEVGRFSGTYEDPLRALTALPGVSTTNDRKAEIRLRAGEPQDTLFRIDGVVLESPYHFRGAKVSAGSINGDAFDRFAVHTSGMGPEISNTVSGEIEVEPSERGADGVFLQAGLGTLATRLTAGGPLSAGGSWLVAARYSSLDLYRSLLHTDQAPPDFGDLYLRARQPLSPSVDMVFGTMGFGSGTELENANGAVTTDLGAQTWVTYAGFDAETGKGMRWSGRLARIAFQQSVDGVDEAPIEARDDRIALQVNGAGEIGPRAGWSAGVETSDLDGAVNGPVGIDGPPGSVAATSRRAGAYTSFLVQASKRWSLSAGTRADFDTRFGWAPLQPRLSANMVADGWALRLAAGRYAQFPRIEQEFLAQNEPLGISTADELSAGVDFPLRDGLQASVTVFARRLQDIATEVVNLYPDLGEPMGTFETGSTRGLELSLRRERGRLQAWAALTFLRATAERDGRNYRRNGDQPFSLDLSLLYLVGAHWELQTRFRAASGLPYTPYLAEGDQMVLGPLNFDRLPSTSRLDLRAAWAKRWDFLETRFYIEVNNILNSSNVRERQLDIDPQLQRVDSVDHYVMPRIPAFGVEITWGR